MKTRLATLLSLIALSLCSLHAQQVVGRILGEDARPLSGATIVLQAADSTYISGTIAGTDGQFALDCTLDRFRLLVQYLGYEPHSALYTSRAVGEIRLTPLAEALQEVAVTASKPLVHIEQGHFVYDAPQLASRLVVNSAYELIKRLPAVVSSGDGISLLGAESLKIVLNGKPSTLSAEAMRTTLEAIPADRVARLEVMHSPSPKYQTRGAVINVVLKSAGAESWSGQARLTLEHQRETSLYPSLNLLYDSPRLTLDALYAPALTRDIGYIGREGWHLYQGKKHDISQEQIMGFRTQTHWLRAASDYRPHEGHELSVAYTTDLTPSQHSFTQTTGANYMGEVHKDAHSAMHNLSASYSWAKGIDLGIDYTNYRYGSQQSLDFERTGKMDIHALQRAYQAKAYLNGRAPLGSSLTILYGLDATWGESRDEQTTRHLTSTATTPEMRSTLRDWVYEAYAGVQTKLGALSLNGSLAANYHLQGEQRLWSFFPRLSATYSKTPLHIWQASLDAYRQAAPYREIAIGTSYLDAYAQIQGNPHLQPMLTYKGSLTYLYKQKYSVQLYGYHKPNYFQQSAYQLPNELTLVYKTLNWTHMSQVGSDIIVPISVGRVWDARLTFVLVHTWLATNDFYGHQLDRKRWSTGLFMNHNFVLWDKPRITLDLSAYYFTPQLQTNYDLGHILSVNAGIKCELMQGKLMLLLKGSDLLERGTPAVRALDLDGNRFAMDVSRYNRTLTLSMTYKFGRYKTKHRASVDTSRFGL